MSNIQEILEWTSNQNADLIDIRLQICNECPICKQTEYGPKCDGDWFINKENEVSKRPRTGFKRGCNCYMKYKAVISTNHCVIGK